MLSPSEILIFTCSGSSNVGQFANQAAVDLQQEGVGKMLCLAGIGGHVLGMIASAKAGKRLVGMVVRSLAQKRPWSMQGCNSWIM